MARRGSLAFKGVFALLALATAAWLLRFLLLAALGRVLVHDDGPAKADFAVVLGGDYSGHRIEKGAALVRRGYVPRVLVSGPPGFYGVRESDLEIAYIVRQGYPAEWFVASPNSALSTRDEAYALLADLRRRDAHSYLLVTSDYHSARAARTFRAVSRATGYTPEMRVVTAPTDHFHADTWWRDREGQKYVFIEWSKTVAAAIGH